MITSDRLKTLVLSSAFLAGLLLSGLPAGHAMEDDLQMWVPVTLQLPVTERLYLSTTPEPRLGNNVRDINLLLFRSGVYYELNKNVHAGVTFDYNTFYVPGFREEYRLGEEILISHKVAGLPAAHRIRLDQRWLEGANTVVRLRIRNQLQYPLGDGPWYLVGRNEYMVNLNSTHNGPNGGFDQNRLFAGVGRNIGRWTNVEGGYQWTVVNNPAPQENLMAHTIYIKLVFNFRDLARK